MYVLFVDYIIDYLLQITRTIHEFYPKYWAKKEC